MFISQHQVQYLPFKYVCVKLMNELPYSFTSSKSLDSKITSQVDMKTFFLTNENTSRRWRAFPFVKKDFQNPNLPPVVEHKKQNLLKQTLKNIYSVQKGFFGVSTNVAKPFLELSQQHYHFLPSQTALGCAFHGFPSSSLPQIPTAATAAFWNCFKN